MECFITVLPTLGAHSLPSVDIRYRADERIKFQSHDQYLIVK